MESTPQVILTLMCVGDCESPKGMEVTGQIPHLLWRLDNVNQLLRIICLNIGEAVDKFLLNWGQKKRVHTGPSESKCSQMFPV